MCVCAPLASCISAQRQMWVSAGTKPLATPMRTMNPCRASGACTWQSGSLSLPARLDVNELQQRGELMPFAAL